MDSKTLENLNHFQKLNLPTNFQINREDLEDNYLTLQKELHPDSTNQTDSEINSILLNQAYKTLKNPVKRAIYLLQLQNINIDDENCPIKPTQEVLLFIMELREEINDNSQDKDKILQIKKIIKENINQEFLEAEKLLNSQSYSKAAQIMIKIKYLDKILIDLKNLAIN